MCHLSSRTALLLTENRFITKKHLKLKVPDSPGENGTFSQNSVLPEMCHLSSRTTLLLTENRFITKKPFKLKVPDSPVRTALLSKKLDSLRHAEKNSLQLLFWVQVDPRRSRGCALPPKKHGKKNQQLLKFRKFHNLGYT